MSQSILTPYLVNDLSDLTSIIKEHKEKLKATEDRGWELLETKHANFLKKIPTSVEWSIRGYTPSWNDGDACTHWQSCTLEDCEDGFDEDSEEQNLFIESTTEERKAFLQDVEALSEFFQICYETNWQIECRWEDGKLKREKKPYYG